MSTVLQSPAILDSDVSASVEQPRKVRRAPLVFAGLAACAVVAGVAQFTLGRGAEATDDAFVEGHVASVAPRIAGQVRRVLVKDNQRVQSGEVLVELDDRDQLARRAAAQADLAAARAQLHAAQSQLSVTEKATASSLSLARGGLSQAQAVAGTTRAGIDRAQADLVAAESQRALAQLELQRSQRLHQAGAIAAAELDARDAAFRQADARVQQAQAQLQSAREGLANSSGTLESARGHLLAAQAGPEQLDASRAQVELAQARVAQAEAALAQAELNLDYTTVRAQTSGVVARRNVELGQLVNPDKPLLAIVPLDDSWVVANFKEDQIAQMQEGQPAQVTIDTYGGQRLQGHVDSLAGGTGSRFALLPPDNASGNFTKVVQRVPVLIKLDPHPGLTLRPGMSATVRVHIDS